MADFNEGRVYKITKLNYYIQQYFTNARLQGQMVAAKDRKNKGLIFKWDIACPHDINKCFRYS